MNDQYFTPEELAVELVDWSTMPLVRTAADFTAGLGSLLRAVEGRWDSASCVALDIDRRVVNQLKREHPTWRIGRCDFLNPRSRAACLALEDPPMQYDLLVLNPPFSPMAGGRPLSGVNGQSAMVRGAMAFLIQALDYLAADGELLALMPMGSLHNLLDVPMWRKIAQSYRVSVCEPQSRAAFEKCSARIVVVRISNRAGEKGITGPQVLIESIEGSSDSQEPGDWKITRGTIQMHKARHSNNGEGLPLIHSTHLRAPLSTKECERVSNRGRQAIGPAVLIPRVGNPSPEKICRLQSHEEVLLSDCVFAVSCESDSDATAMMMRIRNNFELLARHFRGTCAIHITTRRVEQFMRELSELDN